MPISQYVEYCLANRTDFNVCWPWDPTWAATLQGYGIMSKHGVKGIYAHRLAHKLTTGEDPEVVMHRCDFAPCFNFAHLVGGTHEDNMQDMVRKGRHRSGTFKPGMRRWRCTPEEIVLMRKLRADGVSRKDVAEMMGRSIATISKIAGKRRPKRGE
jgi:hypothetical protein